MKVAVVGPFPPPVHGCSYANFVLVNGLSAVGHQCIKFNTEIGSISTTQGSKFSASKAFRFLKNYLSLPKLIGVNVCYITPGQTFFGTLKYAPFVLACRVLSIPVVFHIHGNNFGHEYKSLPFIRKRIFRLIASSASAGIVLSDGLRSNFDSIISANKVFVVENFVAKDLILGSNKIHLEKNTKTLEVLFLSNLMREKGILDFLNALLLAKDSGVLFHAHIAGGIESDIEDDIRNKLSLLGGNVTYHGVVSGTEKISLLERCNVFVLPTYYKMEGQPISILEALAFGNIIVASKHAGIPDVVNASHGFFCNTEDPIGLTHILTDIGSNLSTYVKRFSYSNSQYAVNRFSEDQFVKKIELILNGLLENSK